MGADSTERGALWGDSHIGQGMKHWGSSHWGHGLQGRGQEREQGGVGGAEGVGVGPWD